MTNRDLRRLPLEELERELVRRGRWRCQPCVDTSCQEQVIRTIESIEGSTLTLGVGIVASGIEIEHTHGPDGLDDGVRVGMRLQIVRPEYGGTCDPCSYLAGPAMLWIEEHSADGLDVFFAALADPVRYRIRAIDRRTNWYFSQDFDDESLARAAIPCVFSQRPSGYGYG